MDPNETLCQLLESLEYIVAEGERDGTNRGSTALHYLIAFAEWRAKGGFDASVDTYSLIAESA